MRINFGGTSPANYQKLALALEGLPPQIKLCAEQELDPFRRDVRSVPPLSPLLAPRIGGHAGPDAHHG
jgi:hypothetical protein